ncbi:MAG: hypothetical protein ACOCV3_07995 [Halanaerobiales bacterium]
MVRAKYYTGIGSRKIPQDIKDLMEEIGFQLAIKGYILRSGASPGADTAFELGCIRGEGEMEIFLPWNGFGKRKGDDYIISDLLSNYDYAEAIARKYHPGFSPLTPEAKKLIIRDGYQVLGSDLATRSSFIICWTPDGCIGDSQRSQKTGGTGQAISIATAIKIKVFNLKLLPHRKNIIEWIKKI